MIAFDLKCKNGHIFEGWFENRKAFEKQQKKKMISCPLCNDDSVTVSPSSFGIVKASADSERKQMAAKSNVTPEDVAQLSRKIYDFVEKNFDDVGCDFTKEALKIHYGVSEPRNIRGVSTQAEEKILQEEGVQVMKIPVPVEKVDSDA